MSRRIDYLTFLEKGGDVSKLPYPVAPEDEFLYKACLWGTGLEKAKGFYRCKVHNTGTGTQNFVGGFLDLKGEVATTVKVKATVKVIQGADTPLPTKLGIRLFANNDPIREGVGGKYQSFQDELVSSGVTNNATYTLEASFVDNGNQLSTSIYLKPFIAITRGTNTDKNLIEVHEFLVEVNNVIYDIKDSIFNFQEGLESDFRYILSQIPLDTVTRRRGAFFGKKLACLGDSITFGFDSANSGNALAFPWRLALRDRCGFLNVKNYGANSRRISSDVPDSGPVSFIKQVDQMDKNVDVVTVLGGINDFAQGLRLGEFLTTTKEDGTYDTSTFYGAVQELYRKLDERYKDKLVVVINMLNANNGSTGDAGTGAKRGAELLGTTVQEGIEMYREAIRTCARHYNFPVIELQDLVGFDVFNADDVKKYIPDYLHPNQDGHNLMANVIAEELNKLA